jgi:hypothetical protein
LSRQKCGGYRGPPTARPRREDAHPRASKPGVRAGGRANKHALGGGRHGTETMVEDCMGLSMWAWNSRGYGSRARKAAKYHGASKKTKRQRCMMGMGARRCGGSGGQAADRMYTCTTWALQIHLCTHFARSGQMGTVKGWRGRHGEK